MAFMRGVIGPPGSNRFFFLHGDGCVVRDDSGADLRRCGTVGNMKMLPRVREGCQGEGAIRRRRRKLQRADLRKRRAEGRQQRRDALEEYAKQFLKDVTTIVGGDWL